MADKEGETFDEAVEERVINEEYKVKMTGGESINRNEVICNKWRLDFLPHAPIFQLLPLPFLYSLRLHFPFLLFFLVFRLPFTFPLRKI